MWQLARLVFGAFGFVEDCRQGKYTKREIAFFASIPLLIFTFFIFITFLAGKVSTYGMLTAMLTFAMTATVAMLVVYYKYVRPDIPLASDLKKIGIIFGILAVVGLLIWLL